MLQLKYQSPQIGAMDETKLGLWGKSLLLKIHVITGWVIPDSELQNILVDQFQKKLMEDYSDLNVGEIEYAFRREGTVIQDWGKSMNLNLVDQVLIPYRNKRFNLSLEKESQSSTAPAQILYTDEQLENQQRGDIEAFYQRLLKGQTPYRIPEYFKGMLVKDGLMNQEEYIENFLSHRLNNGFQNIYKWEEK